MKAWIISVVGVICLGILLQIVLPEGKTAKYVKGAFSLLVIFVIISPLPALLKGDMKFVGDIQFEIDSDYIDSTYANYAARLEEQLIDYLKDEGYNVRVKIDIEDGKISCVQVYNASDFSAISRLISERLRIDVDKIKNMSNST